MTQCRQGFLVSCSQKAKCIDVARGLRRPTAIWSLGLPLTPFDALWRRRLPKKTPKTSQEDSLRCPHFHLFLDLSQNPSNFVWIFLLSLIPPFCRWLIFIGSSAPHRLLRTRAPQAASSVTAPPWWWLWPCSLARCTTSRFQRRASASLISWRSLRTSTTMRWHARVSASVDVSCHLFPGR